MEAMKLDVSATPSGKVVFSLSEEATASADVGLTQRAWTATVEYWVRILRERCMMREMLQVANGGRPDPDPVCQSR